MTVIGFCRTCGFTRHAGVERCVVCGTEELPFVTMPGELERGILTLPFGVEARGLDTPEARLLFLSEEGREALMGAVEKVSNGPFFQGRQSP